MQEKTTHAVNPGEDKFILLNGLRFHYVAWGDASLPPLVCLHGLRSYGQTYGPLATTLMDRFHVIGLDQRGRGQTAWDPEQGYYTDRYVADLECLVDRVRAGVVAAPRRAQRGEQSWSGDALFPRVHRRARVPARVPKS